MVGCDSTSVDSKKIDATATDSGLRSPSQETHGKYLVGNDTEQKIILEDSPVKSSILNSVLDQSSFSASVNNTVSGKEWLETQGYSYGESNSAIIIENEYNYYSNAYTKVFIDNEEFSKLTPDIKVVKDLIRADTITWMAFENPTHDSANHTALLTHWRNGSVQSTILVELDVSTAPPTSIREGSFINGEFIPEDIGVEFWLECMASGGAGVATVCAFSNCGWLHCAAVGSVGVLATCIVGLFFQ